MARIIIAVVIGLSGLVWIGQGLGWIGGSAMSDQSVWVLIGAGAVALSVKLMLKR